MPTYAWLARFGRDFDGLTQGQQALFLLAVAQFVEDLQRQRGFRKGLRVKGIRGASGIFEMTWADDGRATFEYGDSTVPGESHVIWRRVGTHEIFDTP
ncbi:MAG TPA: hypothetical protein VND89_11115 [Acidimicrobiales bacterium]|nr:hypothetical protein [Acidimicrobiales bacterium]